MNEFSIAFGNYYGDIGFKHIDGRFYMTLDDACSNDNSIEISEIFYEAAKIEFHDKYCDVDRATLTWRNAAPQGAVLYMCAKCMSAIKERENG